MPENAELIELLKFYKELRTIKRPEVGILTGKTVGQIAGICHQHGIQPWPGISKDTVTTRTCQFPVLRNGRRHVCGKDTVDSLRCVAHQDALWDAQNEVAEKVAVDNPKLVELVKLYQKKATVTLPEVAAITGTSLKQLEGLCERHKVPKWPAISRDTVRDRPCQFPILKHGERYVCGLMRSQDVNADPLRCTDHIGQTWDPSQE